MAIVGASTANRRVSSWGFSQALVVVLAIYSGLAGAQSIEQALRRTYGQPGFIDTWGHYTAAAYNTREGPDLILVTHPKDEVPRTVFRLSAALDDLPVTIGTRESYRRFKVDHLQMLGAPRWEPWLLARITCACSAEVIYISVTSAFRNAVIVQTLTVDKDAAPIPIDSLPEESLPDRSLVGLAMADGVVTVPAPSASDNSIRIVSNYVRFVPDPARDCVACSMRGSTLSPLEVHAVQHYGAILPDSRREWRSRQGNFFLAAIESYEPQMDTIVLREHRGRITLVYQYSQYTIPETYYPPPGSPYLWPSVAFGLDDTNGDGYPEIYATQICSCEIEALLVVSIDFRNSRVLFLEYPYWAAPSDDFTPYVRGLSNPTPDQTIMQAGLTLLLASRDLRWTEDPGAAIPLGAVVEVKEGTLEPRN